MEWKRRGEKKNIFDSYSIKMEIPLKKHKLEEAAKLMEEEEKKLKRWAKKKKFCFGI